MKPKIESDVYLSVVMDVFWQKGDGQKPTPDKAFQAKTPDKTSPVKNLRELRHMHVLQKMGGSEMCDVL